MASVEWTNKFKNIDVDNLITLTPFFRWTGNSVEVGGNPKNYLAFIWLILKHTDIKIGCLILENSTKNSLNRH